MKSLAMNEGNETGMNQKIIRKLCVSAMLVALTVILSPFYIPIGASKCFPVQHLVSVLSAVLLGPWWGVAIAFGASVIRNAMGTGTLLAFPGSMVGALCSGLMFHYTKKYIPTYLSEVIGGGVLGGLMAYPVAAMLLGRQSAFYAYVIPFLTSEAGGVIIAACFIGVLKRTKALDYMRQILQ